MTQLSLDNLQTAVHSALKTWGKNLDAEAEPLQQLLLVQNQLGEHSAASLNTLRHAIDRVLMDGINLLAAQDEIGAKVLNGRFLDNQITRKVAQQLHASPDQVNRWQRIALELLTQLLWQQEQVLRQIRLEKLEKNLPPAPYIRLFGLDEARQNLQTLLLADTNPWLISIMGIGGIGKTSLADCVVRAVLPTMHYQQAAWVRVDHEPMSGQVLPAAPAFAQVMRDLAAQLWPEGGGSDPLPQQLQRLHHACQDQPHLIIIDNLETEAQISHFAQQLAPMTKPSRFLFTSRARPVGTTAVYSHTLTELPFADAQALVRYQAGAMGLVELAQAETAVIQTIYDISGGNPLALKLVVSLADVLPLPQILADLAQNRVGPIEDLYRHIYWQAWHNLSPPAQDLLQAMPLVAASGALPEQMQMMAGLADDAFWTAVHELSTRSLLEIRGTIHQRRYSIHRLTETFLRTEIVRWEGDQ
ncbi:MAG: hypothetical protein H6658_12905 [Ardenticatenaceae bacterium]|nr:hypothetical protein [Ardenticatenaceae bacterium]